MRLTERQVGWMTVLGGASALMILPAAFEDPAGAAQEVEVPRVVRPVEMIMPVEVPEVETPQVEPEPPADRTPQAITEEIMAGLGRSTEFECLAFIFERESSWRPDAIGDEGDSFGLGQRNAPAHGAPPWPWPVEEQVAWFLEYADDRYGGPCPAAERWRERAEARGGAGWW